MAGREEERGRRQSAARRRADAATTGYETTILRMPEGVGFYELKPGVHFVDVIPYTVKKGKNDPGGNPFAEAGELYFERTFYAYKRIGVEEKSYICSSKTFGKPDYIQEYRQKESKNPNADADMLKALAPKERQIWLIRDTKEPDKIQVLEVSYHLFGKLLLSRIKNSSEDEGWDLFYFPDKDGMTLRITVEEIKSGAYSYVEVTAIDFLPRKEPLPEKIVNHGIDLDEMLIEVPYERLKQIFLALPETKKEESKAETKTETKTEVAKEQPKEEPKRETKKIPTAQDAGLSVQDVVMYQGRRANIARISPDGTSLTLMDENDDIIKAVGVDEVSPVGKETKTEMKTETKTEVKKEEVKSEKKDEKDWDADWN